MNGVGCGWGGSDKNYVWTRAVDETTRMFIAEIQCCNCILIRKLKVVRRSMQPLDDKLRGRILKASGVKLPKVVYSNLFIFYLNLNI